MKIRFVREYEIEEDNELDAMIKAEEMLTEDIAEAVSLTLTSPSEDENPLVELFDIENDEDGE